ncbi:MAG: hypothetical protein H6985_15135 [Pseudomonadales bacterium]|nr:hypothetical protein [Halioglobus sp.]MCP5130905.1 hypothetical protein [Pseudomonadales bacterium]
MAELRKKRRGKSGQTKDRVLQARIPRHLDEELREHAEQLGLSVSTVVRNVLLNTFELVEGVVVDSANLALAIKGRKQRALPAQLPGPTVDEPESEVIGWQDAVLNRNGICEQCNCILHKGDKAAVGLPVQARPVLLCLNCLGELSTPETTRPPDPE